MEKPQFEHDCENCKFLGIFENSDLYVCPPEDTSSTFVTISFNMIEELKNACGKDLDEIGEEYGIFRHRSVFGEKGFESPKKKKK